MSTPLRLVPPIAIGEASIVAANIAEDDHAGWAAGTTYGVGARVVRGHRIWESIQAGNTGRVPETSPAWWADAGPTNRHATFDGSNTTATTSAVGAISYTLRLPQSADTIALLQVSGAVQVRVRVQHPTSGTLYDTTRDLSSMPVAAGWWEWAFGSRIKPPALVVLERVPAVFGTSVLVDVTGPDVVSVGVLLSGASQTLGEHVQQGARIGISDYSRAETDAFGNTSLVQRAYAKRATLQLTIPRQQVDSSVEALARVRAAPCLWIGARDQYEALVIFGWYRSFDVVLSTAVLSECSLELQGLT